MGLTRVDKERIADDRMKIQSVVSSLAQIDPAKIADVEAIQECLENADKNLAGALRSNGSAADTRR